MVAGEYPGELIWPRSDLRPQAADIFSRQAHIGRPVSAGKSMGSRPKTQVGEISPILQVVLALVTRPGPIRNFILAVSGLFQTFACEFVHLQRPGQGLEVRSSRARPIPAGGCLLRWLKRIKKNVRDSRPKTRSRVCSQRTRLCPGKSKIKSRLRLSNPACRAHLTAWITWG